MKVLFAVSNENTSQAIIKKYQAEYKQIISYKNVYYFNAILKELQRDKTYDRVIISEDLEQYVNTDYEQMDKFLFDRLDSISDEASNAKGEDIPIILICTERRNKSEPILVKLFGIGIYNAILGNDRSASEVCRLINRPRSKKEAKIYYKIDAEDVSYEKDDENDVSELEIQNILAHYKRIGNDETKCVESFDSIASQYNDTQLRVISKCLPLNVRAILEEKSPKYQQINSYNNKISDKVRVEKKQEKAGTSEILLKNSRAKRLNEPVVIPSAIDATKKKKILTRPVQTPVETLQKVEPEIEEEIVKPVQPHIEEPEEDIFKDIELEELPEIKDIPKEEYMPEIDIEAEVKQEAPEIQQPEVEAEVKEIEIETEPEIESVEEEVVQPVKRGRGRPKKVVTKPVDEQPKRKRGRPKKVVEPEPVEEVKIQESQEEEDEAILPGFNNMEEEPILDFDNLELGFENNEGEEETILPGFENSEEDEETVLPGFENSEDEEETVLPGFENSEEDEEIILPGFESDEELNEIVAPKDVLRGIKVDEDREYDENPALQGIDNSEQDFDDNDMLPLSKQYTSVLNNLRNENREISEYPSDEKVEYPELNLSQIMNPNQKIVAFVGTSKNGTSFLVNNVAEILSTNGVDTAILDLTQNRNSYFIYTKNEEELRHQSNYIMNNLRGGKANGIQEHKNLTIYTSAFENDENLEAVEPIIQTLLQAHTVVLMDCDFTTPMKYFKYAQEIYLVQSMDVLTIQPLTAFLRHLSDKGMFEESKARVVLNKFVKTREINEELLIGGISIYNDAAMTVRRELFNRKTVPYITIPFDLKSYLRYLDGLVTCDVSLKGYTKEFLQSLKNLSNMVYPTGKKPGKYMPPSVKNNSNTFSPRVNDTLNQMKKNY